MSDFIKGEKKNDRPVGVLGCLYIQRQCQTCAGRHKMGWALVGRV
jgi:hypothetical protein